MAALGFRRRTTRKPVRRNTWTRLMIERLEDRCLPSIQAYFDPAVYNPHDDVSSVQIKVSLIDNVIGRVDSTHPQFTVSYSTQDGSAKQGTDYTAITNGLLIWPANDFSQKSFSVSIINHRGGGPVLHNLAI